MKKLLCTLMAVLMTATLAAGCAGGTTEETSENAASAQEGSSDETINVGIIQYMLHASLDEAYEGFVDGLAEAGWPVNKNS